VALVVLPNRPAGTDPRSIADIIADFDAILTAVNGGLEAVNMSTAFKGDLAGTYKTAFPFGAGWGNFGGAYENATYSKVGRTVFLQGTVSKTGGTPTIGDVIGTLPVGFRPASHLLFAVATGATHTAGIVEVQSDGDVIWTAGNTVEIDYTSLSGISFVVN
jgi:hypothetical protein